MILFSSHFFVTVALLGIVVISILIYIPIATSTWTKLVIYGRISYLNID